MIEEGRVFATLRYSVVSSRWVRERGRWLRLWEYEHWGENVR